MRTLASSVSLLLIGSHALADDRVDPIGAADGEAVRGNVLVWHDATFLTEPSETATTIQLATFDAARKDRVGHALPMRAISTKGAFVEVEPIRGTDCTWSRMTIPDDIAKLRLFVRRADLAPVLTKPYANEYPDGTKITIEPGMPVVATAAGGHVISLRGDELATEIPAASVGHAYKPKRKGSISMSASVLDVAPGTKATLGDQSLALTAWQGAAIDRRGEMTVVALEDRCATVHVAVPSEAIKDADEDEASLDLGGGGGTGVLGLRDEHYLPRLTPLSVGKRRIAYVAKPIYLFAAPKGKTACVDRRLEIESSIAALDPKHTGDKLRLCAPAAKVVRERFRSARSGNGSTRR